MFIFIFDSDSSILFTIKAKNRVQPTTNEKPLLKGLSYEEIAFMYNLL